MLVFWAYLFEFVELAVDQSFCKLLFLKRRHSITLKLAVIRIVPTPKLAIPCWMKASFESKSCYITDKKSLKLVKKMIPEAFYLFILQIKCRQNKSYETRF